MRKALPYLAGIFGALFLVLTTLVMYAPQSVMGFDAYVHALVVPLQNPAWANAVLVFTNFGSVAGIIAGVIVVMCVYRHRPDVVARLFIALVGTIVSGEFVKELVHRARPETLPWLQPILNSYSYPSGHSDGSIVFYGFLAVLLYMHTRSRFRKVFAILLPSILILLIGISRLVLNYHYATDVLGGYLLGAFWLTFSLSLPLYYELYHHDPEQELVHSEPLERPVV